MNLSHEDILPRVLAVITFIGLVTLALLLLSPADAADLPDRAAWSPADSARVQALAQAVERARTMTMAPDPALITRGTSNAIPPNIAALLPAPGIAPRPDQNAGGLDPRSLQWILRMPPMPEGAAMRYTPRELEILLRTPPTVGTGGRP